MYEITALDSILMKAFQENYKHIIEIKRNEPCPCGSGLKFKHCHIKSDNQWEKGLEFYDGKFSYENVSLTLELLKTIREILSKLKSHNSIDEEFGLELLEKLYSTYDPAIEQLQKTLLVKRGVSPVASKKLNFKK
ncbi:SEC-C domain-containing protein [Bacillus cereus]